jgi:DNA end-binding protein Ku
MARAFWKGSISFGLVEIPVTLRPALQSDDLSFTLLNRKDFAPVGYKRYDKSTGREVSWDQIVRGYEYEPDEYVVLSDDELRSANAKATQTVEIVEFVEGAEIDPLYFDTPYYVEPQKRGSKSYALLREALRKSGKVGIARVVLRTRQHVAALLVRGEALVLNLLRYAHELRPAADLDVPAKATGVSPREVHMAEQLIDGMAASWRPEEFRDEYRDDVMALVKKKIKAHQTHTIVEPEAGPEAPRPSKEVVDLMPLLKQSLESRRGGAKGSRSSRPSPAERSGSSRPAPAKRSSGARSPRAGSRAGRTTARPARGRRERRSA